MCVNDAIMTVGDSYKNNHENGEIKLLITQFRWTVGFIFYRLIAFIKFVLDYLVPEISWNFDVIVTLKVFFVRQTILTAQKGSKYAAGWQINKAN